MDTQYLVLVQGNHREVSLVENLLRAELIPLEEAEAMAQMMAEFFYTQAQLAEIIGKAQSSINETLSLNRLPDTVKAQCRTNPNIPKYTLVEVAKLKTPAAMGKAFTAYMAKQASQAQEKPKQSRATKEATLLRKVDTLNGRLATLSYQEWAETDKEDLARVMRDISETATRILRDLRGEEPETEEGAEEGSAEPTPNVNLR